MSTAFAYARVSTKDQDAIGNSMPEQFNRIESFAQDKGIEILRSYRDTESAYHDNREQFRSMTEDAIKLRPTYIIMDDSSRFARTRQKAIETKSLLRKHGINILFVNEPLLDPNTVAAIWLEGIQEIKNEATSREIAFHVMKGMTRNLQVRDRETNWCYKNGGIAPYGYKTTHLTRGQDHKGKPILKTIWELDPEAAPIVHWVIIDLFTKQLASYRQIRDQLNANNILSPRGDKWATTSIVEMLKENRMEQYSGTAFWNKESKKVIGQKYNPREKWVEVENAHPAIITKDELEAALARKKTNRYNAPDGATRESKYLLTGKNFENKPLFTCSACGGNVIGYGNSSHNWSKYICGTNRARGPVACSNNWLVDQNWLEQSILATIDERYTTPDRIEELIADISAKASTRNKDLNKEITTLEGKVKANNTSVKRLLEAIKSGIDPSIVAGEVNNLKTENDSLEDKISILRKSFAHSSPVIDVQALRNFFINFNIALKNATIQERRQLIRTFVRHIELVPETKEIRVEFYPDHIVQSIGAGDRDRTGTNRI
ncbi:MAG: recombinase family protein [Bacillota bacterium]